MKPPNQSLCVAQLKPQKPAFSRVPSSLGVNLSFFSFSLAIRL
jgi:hypothetical protein